MSAVFRVPIRVYRTADGRLVKHGDPDAAFLAYPAGMELSEEEATRFGVAALFERKSAGRAQDKMASRPADKAVHRTNTKEHADG